MRKEVPRESPTKTPRAVVPSPGKGQKRAAPSVKTDVKKKKSVTKPEGESKSPSPEAKKKKLLKPKVVLTKLNPGSVPQLVKKPAKDPKERKETSPKPVKPKPKKVIVSKATKKEVKLENDPKRAKIVRAVKDVKKARSVVASKMAKISPKKLSDSGTVRKISGKINVVKQHNIVKRVNKMSGKKPCVVSVKISNAHSTVTLSVKQNKQVKKDSMKCSKSSGGKGNERSTISIVKKGIASRRKSTSKECTSQESTPSQSPTRDTSPIRSKDGKMSSVKTKKSENVKPQKKISKQSSIESKKGLDDKGKEKQGELKDNNRENCDGKTEVFIKETVKIKTENDGEDQNMEIEFMTSADKDSNEEKGSKSCESPADGDTLVNKSKIDNTVQDTKVKSPLNDYGNLKSVDSCTSDEIPLEVLKSKQKHIKQEKDADNSSQSSAPQEKSKKGKDSPRHDAVDHLPLSQRDDDSSNSNNSVDNKKNESEKQTKSNTAKKISKASLKKMDQESVAKLKISSKTKEKLKDLAIRKQKVAKLVRKSKLSEEKLRKEQESGDNSKEESNGLRRKKLMKFWNGPKRHRVASLNAIAKVHCLYENESRGALNDVISSASALQRAIQESKKLARKLELEKGKDKEKDKDKKVVAKKPTPSRKKSPEPVTRSLRTNPGVRSVGRNFDILNVISSTSLSSSSSEESSDSGEEKKQLVLPPSLKQKQQQIKKEESEQTTDDESSKKTPQSQNEDSKDGVKKVKKRRRKRNELTMDLKDMVVRKRMASLNASAIMTASYSTEKKSKEERRKEEEQKKERKKKKKVKEQPDSTPEPEESSAEEDVILRTTNNKQKVAVIVNQDTDVTITGVYVNSTTRSTHHEGYCSIAGMQYRISSTSHTQTEATAVATETVLHAEHPACLPEGGTAQTVVTTALAASPCKSYTPLSALSSMQPPGHHHPHPQGPPCQGPRGSPLQRRHGCSSAFTAPPNYPPPGQPPPGPPPHPDVHGNYRWEIDMPCCSVQPRPLCYYQPAGPLISHHHHHHSSTSVTSKLPPPPTPPPSSAPHPPSESSDTEVVAADNPPPGYRYPPGGQPYNYGYQYYPSPPASSLQYPQQSHYHQDICYSPSGYPPGYFPKGHYPHAPYRRYGPHQYYPPQEFYNPPNAGSNPPPPSNSQMMVTAPSGGQSSSTYPPSEGGYPPPAPIVDPYPPPPPQSYYPGYSAGPPPPCYSTHSPSSRGLFIDAAYQGCPCPMQSCPKNVHTGPLTGASKGSIKNQTTPLPPVALALPLEPPGALGPPSPARGSAGMPPPPSPALATARNPPQSPPAKPSEQTGLLTIGKMVTDAVLLAEQMDGLAEFVPKSEPIKLEVEDIVKIEATEEVKCNRKRRKSLKIMNEVKRQAIETVMTELDIKVQSDIKVQDLQERLVVKEEPEKEKEKEKPVEKQLPLSDNGATVPVKIDVPLNGYVQTPLNGNIKTPPKKRKSTVSDCEPAAKVAKCVKGQKVLKKKCVKKDKKVAEENIAPEEPVAAEPAKVVCRRNSKPVERRKSSCSPHNNSTRVTSGARDPLTDEESPRDSETEVLKKKKVVRGKKVQEKTKADHLLRSHGKAEVPAPVKERRISKSGSSKSVSPVRGPKKGAAPPPPPVDPSADSPVCLPGLRKSLTPKWSNGWSWEGTPYKAKIFLNIDDGAVVRKCYPAMRHAQGDVIAPRDCILLKSGPRKIDLPFVAKVAAMWENPDDGEMMVSLLWYYRPEHTEQGRRSDDIPDEIFASRHKDTNSVACIEDKCFVLTFNEYCRYRKSVRRQEECLGAGSGARLVPPPEGGSYPRLHRQPPGRVAPDLVFFCRRVYDFRQKRILKNPC